MNIAAGIADTTSQGKKLVSVGLEIWLVKFKSTIYLYIYVFCIEKLQEFHVLILKNVTKQPKTTTKKRKTKQSKKENSEKKQNKKWKHSVRTLQSLMSILIIWNTNLIAAYGKTVVYAVWK